MVRSSGRGGIGTWKGAKLLTSESEDMYNKLIGYGQTGHDNMWDSIGQGTEGKGKGKVVFCTKTNGPKEYMDTHEKRQELGFRAGTEQ